MTGKLATTILVLIFIISSFSSVNAQQDFPYEAVNPPDGISYLFKRIREKITIFFSFSNERKINNYKKLVQVRLAELKFIIENKEIGYFEKSTQRYFTTAGQLTELLTNKNTKTRYDEVREMLSSHIPILSRLRDTYNPTTAEWRFVEDDINYIKGYINSLSSP